MQTVAQAWALAETWCRRLHLQQRNMVHNEQSAVAALISEATNHDEELQRFLTALLTAPQGQVGAALQEAACALSIQVADRAAKAKAAAAAGEDEKRRFEAYMEETSIFRFIRPAQKMGWEGQRARTPTRCGRRNSKNSMKHGERPRNPMRRLCQTGTDMIFCFQKRSKLRVALSSRPLQSA